MKTEIFADKDAFYARPDWTVNGVSEAFAAANVGWDEERGNEGCWNCSDCSGCSRCFGCSDCSDCSREIGARGKRGSVQPSSVVPVIPNIHQAVRAAIEAEPGQFDMSHWHGQNACGTTHCRGGMVVHLAGKEGKALEAFHNTELAAYLIYQASSPLKVPFPRFYETNAVAMADIVRLAEEEKALTQSPS